MAATHNNLIVGLGKTGLACARFLAAHGEAVTVCDSRERPPGLDALRAELPDVPVSTGGFDPALFAAAGRIVLSPGVPPDLAPLRAAQARGTPVVGDIELFALSATAPVVAITGTNGKSTVTTLLGDMAAACGRRVLVGGNLGRPAIELLDQPAPELYVLELSSYQLEVTASLDAVAATVLNIAPDHLDRYADYDAYIAAKARVFRGSGAMLLNRDDPRVMAMAVAGRATGSFGLDAPADGEWGLRDHAGEVWLAHGGRRLLPESRLRIPGRHNLANALAALALAELVGLELDPCLHALQGFTGLRHRAEWVGERDGVRWCNDSKATNVGAAIAAIRGLPGPLVLIAGGDTKGADFTPLGVAAEGLVRGAILVGDEVTALAAALDGHVPLQRAADMRDAVRRAAALAKPGDTVLLSPACASFDRYRDFEARGDDFRAEVEALLGSPKTVGAA